MFEPSLKPYYIKKGRNFKNYSNRGIRFKPRHNELGGLYLSTENKFGRSMIRKHFRRGLKNWLKRKGGY